MGLAAVVKKAFKRSFGGEFCKICWGKLEWTNFQTCSHPFCNLKILEALLLPPLHKTVPQLREFQVQFGNQTHSIHFISLYAS